MAKIKPQEPKVELEREYIVPLRRGWLKVPKHKRGNKAIKTLKEFIAKHMKIYDRDLRKIKVDNLVNNEIRFRGMEKPPAKIKVSVKKYDNDIVRVELVDIPTHVKFAKLREEKKQAKLDKKLKSKPKIEKPLEAPQEESEESKEKEQASKEENLKIAKNQAKELKHTSKDKKVIIQRKALAK